MYDDKGRWIEQDDDDEPARLRCSRGHFLPRTPTHVLVEPLEPLDARRKRIPYASFAGAPGHVEWVWACFCGNEVVV